MLNQSPMKIIPPLQLDHTVKPDTVSGRGVRKLPFLEMESETGQSNFVVSAG